MTEKIKIVECPRDAMQGIKAFIPTAEKIEYINQLLKVGYDTIDFGSFVSPKAIPQLVDTGEIVKKLDISATKSKLLAIVGNAKGAEKAVCYDEISYLGFPYSLSQTFLQKNINSTREEAFKTIEYIQNLCMKSNKKLVLYFSLAFANPYGEKIPFAESAFEIRRFTQMGVEIFSMADTVGIAKPKAITKLFDILKNEFENIDFGMHLHTTPSNWYEKVDAAYKSECYRFDSVLKGYGGCPMSGSELVGNLDTNNLIEYFNEKNVELNINRDELLISNQIADRIFSKYR